MARIEKRDQHHVGRLVVVPRRLLEINAVDTVLGERLAFELIASKITPAATLAPVRPSGRRNEHPEKFSEQMVIGGRVLRQMAGDEMAMLPHRGEPTQAQRLPGIAREENGSFATQEVPGERPVHESQRKLKAASPVHPARVRTRAQPRIDECPASLRVPRIMRQMPCLGERHKLGMAIRLPQILDIPDEARVAIVD